MRISQTELADYLDVSQASVSQATSNGHKCRGYPVRAWAVFDGAGRVSGYDVPERVMRRASPASVEDEPETLPATTSEGSQKSAGVFSMERFVRQNSGSSYIPGLGLRFDDMQPGPVVDASQRTSLLPENEDYFPTVSSGGAAYVMHTAIENDNGTARGAMMVSGAAIGGLTGYYVTDGDPVGAAIGVGVGWLATWTGIQSANT